MLDLVLCLNCVTSAKGELEEVKSKGYNVEIKKYVEPEPRDDSMPF
uniref:Uncharacterized protein n=1 Tax=uncultured Flavobacteriia bacterium TaxID=212695 RepID=H6RDR2_9BACT|nr:hypothetical protein VIS_S3ARA10039 [uncultured Flavobacteriia bacterium]